MNVKFFNQTDFIHLSDNPKALLRKGYSFGYEGTRGGTLYGGGISVTLPDYVDSWLHIAKLGGSTEVAVRLPPGKLLVDFYATFKSKDVMEVEEVKKWALAQGKWKVERRTQIAQYDEDGEFQGWMEDTPGEDDETREYEGFSGEDMGAIFNAYVESQIPKACGVWYWDEDDPLSYSAPHGIIFRKFAGKLLFSKVIAEQLVKVLLDSEETDELYPQ